MSEAPLEWPATAYILHPSVKSYADLVSNPERRKYIRADLVGAAIKRALEGAAAEISPHPDHDKADWTEYAHHAHRLAQLIRALDPAQFIEEPKE